MEAWRGSSGTVGTPGPTWTHEDGGHPGKHPKIYAYPPLQDLQDA